MTTRLFKLANCANFDPAELLAEKRLSEMDEGDFLELAHFHSLSEDGSVDEYGKNAAVQYIEDEAGFDMYRWSNWTPAPAKY